MTKIFYNNNLINISEKDIYDSSTKTVYLDKDNDITEEKFTFFDLMNNILN